MRRFKNWLITKFLPTWAKEELLAENNRLQEQIAALQAEKANLRSYIEGLERGIRAQRRIIIHNGEASK